jgi:hypothetical protein
VLVLDMIEILPPLAKYKYDTWRILPVKCYIDNSVRLQSYIRNVNRYDLLLQQQNDWGTIHPIPGMTPSLLAREEGHLSKRN